MTSPTLSNEKFPSLVNQATSHSNASSATYISKLSSRILQRVSTIFHSKTLPDDVERQSGFESANHCDGDDDDEDGDAESIFKVGGLNKTKVRSLEACPMGYPRLAAFKASEQNFMLYRGFSCVHARLLLNLQTSIQMLEAELDRVDRFHDSLGEEQQIRLRSLDMDMGACDEEKQEGLRARDIVLEELRVKVCQYDELLVKARELVSFQRPTSRDYKSVRNWIHNKAPLVEEDQDYILWQEDIITLRHGREWANFDGLVEALLHKIDCGPVRWMFRTEDQTRKTSDDNVHYFAPSRVSKLVNLMITGVIFILLAAPVVGMYQLSTLKTNEAMFAAIGVLMVFTLLFAAALSLLTKARRHELFAATAAYCAVLVVFIGSTNFS